MIEKYKLYAGTLFAALWISLCWGFVQEEFIGLLERVRPFVFLLLDLIFIILGVFALRNRRDAIFVGLFVIIVSASALLNSQGLVTVLNGSRDFIGLVLAAPVIRRLLESKYSERFSKSFDRQLQIFLYVQAVCITWQFIRYGAGDAGGGSMGEGASGTISALIYFVSFYLMCRRWDLGQSYIHNIRNNIGLVVLLYPTFLNETKISLVLVVFYFVMLVKINRQYLLKLAAFLPLIILVGITAVWSYTLVVGHDADEVFSEDNMYEYLVGEDIEELVELAILVQDEEIETDNLWVMDIPRISKLAMVPVALEETGGKLWLGAGVGQFKGASVLSKTKFASKYAWLLQGSRPFLFFVIVQLGVIGLAWAIANFISIVQTRNDGWFSWNMRLYMYLLVLMSMLYNDSFRLFQYCFILFYVVMIGLASHDKPLKVTAG
ncbi:MAG: hypothetical protein K2J65_02815 [Duncaniella sp.]|nr:hypothetical protein [Duncaniella sp.]